MELCMLYLMLFLTGCFIVQYIISIKKNKSTKEDMWFLHDSEAKPNGSSESHIA